MRSHLLRAARGGDRDALLQPGQHYEAARDRARHRTGADVLATALAVAKAINKQPVVARVCDGFIANRAFDTYWREAEFLVEEGASPYDIDKVALRLRHVDGPFAVADLVGLDVGQLISQAPTPGPAPARPLLGNRGRYRCHWQARPKERRRLVRYGANARSGTPDPEIESLIARYRKARASRPARYLARRSSSVASMQVINEGAKELEEGIAIRASDIDVAAVYGYGFPSWRGGPMRYADEIGLKAIAVAVERFHGTQGYWWQPSRRLLGLPKAVTIFRRTET